MFASKSAKLAGSVSSQSLTTMLLERLDEAAFLINNHDDKVAYSNRSAQELLGYSAEGILAITIKDLPFKDLQQIWSNRCSRTSWQQSLYFTDKFSTQNAEELAVEITISCEQNTDWEYSCLLIHVLKPAINREESILPHIPQLETVFEFIEENHARSISLKDVAAALGYCPSYLTDLVRRCSGQTVNHWIIKRRIALACKLLQETTQSVNQIALATGYQNEGHFFRQFRQHCGMTPLTWRKSQQRGQSS
jgi:AraC-like DNA-binding protein